MDERPNLDVVVPMHDEVDTVESTTTEIFAALSDQVRPRLIACEDGSTDDTLARLRGLAERYPITIITSAERKGYMRALLDGLDTARTDYVLVVDADGQCDPGDFALLWREREHADLVIGWRTRRVDSLARRALSRGFAVVYSLAFAPPVHDPSCPYALLCRVALGPVLASVARLPYGFWWELVARATRAGLTVREVPVTHRARRAGGSRAFPWRRMPTLAGSHLLGLARLWLDTR